MANYNKVILVGNLTRDPEIKYTAGGTAVTTIGLAVNHKYRQGEEMKEEALFIDVVVFGKQAENVSQYLQKGRSILVDGRLQYRKWEAQDGQTRTKHQVVADTIQFLGSPGGKGGGERPTPAPGETPVITEDEIPF
jgi:single-strand DNA-binding protein